MNPKTQKIIDVIQWVLIVTLLCIVFWLKGLYMCDERRLEANAYFEDENTYLRIYESQKFEDLVYKNRVLHDSLQKLKDLESVMEIKFREEYSTDTITVEKFIVKHDTIVVFDADNNISFKVDSVYSYVLNNDTVSLKINVKAKELEWVNSEIKIFDSFLIVNSEKDDLNYTMLKHSNSLSIEETTMWHRKNKTSWKENIVVGPQVGLGYGIFNGKADVYVGIGISYNFK